MTGEDMAKEAASKVSETVGKGAEKMRDTMSKATKGFEKLSSFHKESFEAVVEAASIASKGFEKIQAEIAAYTKTSTEGLSEASKSIFGAKTIKDAFEAQSAFASSSLETYFGEMTKLNEMFMAITKDAMAPLQSRTKAFASMFEPAA